MNKKFLSAILFGALMVTSTGTFVSCKDYDDDIKGLQTQIDSNKNAIAELQKLVGAGNWVTNVTASGENLVVTMSNGTTATIAGIKGADGKDGKNAAEWTISEDGFWCVDGVKTANVAVAKDGKDGLTAPSPSISEDGMWVVYAWDEAKGEFVAEETEIPAAGTSAYVVLKNGVYTLNIADETGEFVEVSLPATAESFVINEIANMDVVVKFAYGEWKTPSTKKDKEMFDKLAAEFPALKEYKDKQLVEQGGKLPFIVSPANVEFTKEHTFALVDLKGKDIEATLSNPTMGMPENIAVIFGSWIESRASEGSAVWSLDFAPAKNKKGTAYVEDNNGVYALVASGAKGVISATPYAYRYDVEEATGSLDLTANGDITKLYNEEGIDIFASAEDDTEHFTLPATVLNGMYILEATDPAQVEEYGISIEGSVVTIADMPKGKNIAEDEGIELKLTAIAVNGAVAEKTFKLGVDNVVAATGALEDMEVVLTGSFNKNGSYKNATQEIYWNLEALELSALQMKNFVDATATLTIKDADGEALTSAAVTFEDKVYDADKKVTTDYTKAAYIRATIDASKVVPGKYDVVLTASSTTSGIILKAVSELTLVNPEENLWSIDEACLDEDGVVIVATGATKAADGTVSATGFELKNIFVGVDKAYTIASVVDEDYAYENDETEFPAWLAVSTNSYVLNGGIATWNTDGEVEKSEVDKVRTLKVTFNLFGNQNNQQETEIKVKWTSPIYAEDAADVITMTPAKLKIKFDDPTSVDANKVKFTSITSAIYAQGGEKGKAYQFFTVENGRETGTDAKYNYSAPKSASGYLLNSTGNIVTLTVEEYLAMCEAFGVTPNKTDYVEGNKVYKLTTSDWAAIWAVATNYYNEDGTANYWDKNSNGLNEYDKKDTNGDGVKNYVYNYNSLEDYNDSDKAKMAIYTTFKSKIAFTMTDEATQGDKKYLYRNAAIKSVNFKAVNEADTKFFSMSAPATTGDYSTGATLTAKASSSIDKTALTSGKKVIPMEMIITDVWGKVMTYEFEVEISL